MSWTPLIAGALFAASAIWTALGQSAAALQSSGRISLDADPLTNASSGFERYKVYLIDRARHKQIREEIIQATIPSLRLNEQAIRLDRAQRPTGTSASTSSPPLRPYVRQHVTSSLIRRGQDRYHVHWSNLYRIQERHGVDAATLVAIFGKETSYGAYTGGFDLLEVLASLAYEGRRREMFEKEFFSALELVQGGLTRAHLRGSYAGATGYPQFMPSVVLRLRADGDNDGRSDIWNNEVDAFASIANYLRNAGWKSGVPWGVAVQVPPSLDRNGLRQSSSGNGCRAAMRHSRWLPLSDWRALGVRSANGTLADTEPMALLEPEGRGETAYLVTRNFHAILDYNCSNAYAMSVALLSDAIARRGGATT